MDPKVIQLCAAVVAIGAAVASVFVPPDMAGDLRALSTFLVGWVLLKRPGDVRSLGHSDDVPAMEHKR